MPRHYAIVKLSDNVSYDEGSIMEMLGSTMQRGERLVSKGRLKILPLITHHIGLSRVAEGVRMAAFRPEECIKIVVGIV